MSLNKYKEFEVNSSSLKEIRSFSREILSQIPEAKNHDENIETNYNSNQDTDKNKDEIIKKDNNSENNIPIFGEELDIPTYLRDKNS